MLDLLFANPILFFLWAIALLVAVTVHEFAHALAADKLGDPTPRAHGRLTLNPVAHLDPLGTLALLIAHIGWGKPVPIDPYNLDSPRRDNMLIAFAGPASNFILAILLSFLILKNPLFSPPISQYLNILISPIIVLSIGLATFNLIPIPPLDGSKVLLGLLPREHAARYEEVFNRYGAFLLLLLIFPFAGTSLAISIVSPIINTILNFLL